MPCFYTTDVRGVAVNLLTTATYGQQNKLSKSSSGCIPSSGIKSMKIYLTRLLTVFTRGRVRPAVTDYSLLLSGQATILRDKTRKEATTSSDPLTSKVVFPECVRSLLYSDIEIPNLRMNLRYLLMSLLRNRSKPRSTVPR